MAEPGLELWSSDLIAFLLGSSGAALFNLVTVSQEDLGLEFPQYQAEVAEATYQPARVMGRKPGP